MNEKRIFELSPMEKSWSDHIKCFAAILNFGRKGGRPQRNFSGEPFFFNQYNVLGHLKHKMAAVVVGAGKLYSSAPIF